MVQKIYETNENKTVEFLSSLIPEKDSQVKKQLFGRNPKFTPILEPDEIIWENLAYTGSQQRVRKYIMQTIGLLFLVINTLFTLYLGVL